MENDQTKTPPPAEGKPVTDTTGAGKLNRSVVGVFDQLLNAVNDNVLNTQDAVRENTGQLRVMASTVELVRGLPDKMMAVEKGLTELGERVDTCSAWISKLSERMNVLELSMRQVVEKPLALESAMGALRGELRRHAELFENPQEKTVHHRHYLHYYVLIIIGLLWVGTGLGWLWMNARGEAGRNATNDILWRGARQYVDSSLLGVLDTLKNRYESDPGQFRKDVLAQEEHSEELAEKLQEAAQKRQEADEKRTEADQKQGEANEEQQAAEKARREAEELKKQRRKR